MRITILTVGSRGDVQPYVALGKGLAAAGHDVTLASHEPFREFVEENGLRFWPTAGNPIDAIQGEAGRHWLESSQNPLTFVSRMFAVAKPMMWEILDAWADACVTSELIVYPILASMGAQSLGEKLGIPVCAAYLQHVHRSAYYPWSLAQPKLRLGPLSFEGKFYNKASHFVAEQIFWLALRPLVNQWRVETLGLPAYPFSSEFAAWVRRRPLCLYGISPTVLPKPADWGGEVHITGYWQLKTEETWQPPEPLQDFLNSGPPPVYIGFGSMSTRNPEEVAEIAITSLQKCGQRGILLSGWGGIQNHNLPDDLFALDAAPHDWLFPQMAAIVHHGGAGTTAASLHSGVPTIVTPFFADQPFWGWRAHTLGAGPEPIPRRKLSAEKLSLAIDEALSNPAIRTSAADVGRSIRAEDGVSNAVKLIGAYSISSTTFGG